MIHLQPVDYLQIQHWFVDYQKRTKDFELPSDQADFLGVYNQSDLIGYFILLCPDRTTVEIRQGYLRQDARCKGNSQQAMKALERLAKEKGFQKIVLGTYRANRGYIRWMEKLGFKIQSIDFVRNLNR